MTTISVVTASLVGFLVTAIMGYWLIPLLHKLKYGQTILEEGPNWHKNKQGTPTMGGIMFIVGVTIAFVVAVVISLFSETKPLTGDNTTFLKIVAGILMSFAFGFMGFIDDYIKVAKKQNLGLRAYQKILIQVLVATTYLVALYAIGNTSTIVLIPFIGQMDFGLIYYPFMVVLIVGIVNAANLTDGVDGLLGSVTFVVAIFFVIIATVLQLHGITVLSAALVGSLIAFLAFNLNPAKVFMGDTGSMFLGGLVITMAFGINMPIMLFFVGFIYCCEALSVILQVISFKTTGKRIFKMSPIHHHFEMSGYSENKIVILFSGIQLLLCGIAYAIIVYDLKVG